MRITNKIIQNNNLNNLTVNKVLEDKLATQMSSLKKINRPSDDPVIAIRALRLRSNFEEVKQYNERNAEDAESWLDITDGALSNVSGVLESMVADYTKGANGDLTTDQRDILLTSLKHYRDEVYSTADVDYAGRYVFAGYRTDTSIKFGETRTGNNKLQYDITYQFNRDDIDQIDYVDTVTRGTNGAGQNVVLDLRKLSRSNYEDYDGISDETNVTSTQIHRIILPYQNIDDLITGADGFTISHVISTGTPPVQSTENVAIVPSKIYPHNATDSGLNQTVNGVVCETPYDIAVADPDAVVVLKDTGEILLGSNIYSRMMGYRDNDTTANINEGEIRINFRKSEWLADDLRPEHYFSCTSTDTVKLNAQGGPTVIDYNHKYLEGKYDADQPIEYDVGTGQVIRINTMAKEAFNPIIGRSLDDLIASIEDVQNLEKIQAQMAEVLKLPMDLAQQQKAQKQYDAVSKAYTLAKNTMQHLFEHGITRVQGFSDAASLAFTACGSRGSKLALIKNRLEDQQVTFEDLKSKNEDIDMAEVITNLTSAQLTYQASLMAIGKVSNTTLLNYL